MNAILVRSVTQTSPALWRRSQLRRCPGAGKYLFVFVCVCLQSTLPRLGDTDFQKKPRGWGSHGPHQVVLQAVLLGGAGCRRWAIMGNCFSGKNAICRSFDARVAGGPAACPISPDTSSSTCYSRRERQSSEERSARRQDPEAAEGRQRAGASERAEGGGARSGGRRGRREEGRPGAPRPESGGRRGPGAAGRGRARAVHRLRRLRRRRLSHPASPHPPRGPRWGRPG